jgi:protein subunit release factor B
MYAQISISEAEVTITAVRAQGAGGQNVNKVNSKAEVRFHIDSSDWLQ